jgi:hypothetical protein
VTKARFLDSIDTVRDLSHGRLAHISTGQMMLHLLDGQTLRISEPQAFDSIFLLDHAQEKAFRKLIVRGKIQIVLQKGTTDLIAAFRKRLLLGTEGSAPFFKFSAWKTLASGHQAAHLESRKHAMAWVEDAEKRRGSLPAGADTEFRAQWTKLWDLHQALREGRQKWKRVSAEAQLPEYPMSGNASTSLSALLQHARTAIAMLCPEYLSAFDQMMAHGKLEQGGYSNSRSPYHAFLTGEGLASCRAEELEVLESILNMAYNLVVGESLGSVADLTTERPAAQSVMHEICPNDVSVRLEAQPPKASGLAELSWDTLLEVVRELDKQPSPAERTKELLSSGFIERMAEEIAEEKPITRLIYKLVPRASEFVVKDGVPLLIWFALSRDIEEAHHLKDIGESQSAEFLSEVGEVMGHKAAHAIARHIRSFVGKNLVGEIRDFASHEKTEA